MKIINTSDWHLGNLFHGTDRLPEHEHFLQWLLEQIVRHQPDALLVAGDVFDNGNPSAVAQGAYYDFLADAAEACPAMQMVITAGNHDSASRLEAPRPLLRRNRVEVRGKVRRSWHVDADGTGSWHIDYDDLIVPISGTSGERAVVLAVPYLRHDMMVGAESYSQGVRQFLRSLTARARQLHPDVPLVMMAHMYATGADIATHDASEKLIIGGQEQVDMGRWDDHPDYLTCGHIHKRQHIWDAPWARYSGSVLPMSFAEKDYTHGVDLVTIGPGRSPQVEQLVYAPQHRLVVLPDDDSQLTPAKLKRLINDTLADRPGDKPDEHSDYVVLKVYQNSVNNDQVKELEALVGTKNAVLCRIQKIVPLQQSSTLSQVKPLTSIDDIIHRDPMETMREAFVIKHNQPMSQRQEALLRQIITHIHNTQAPNS